MLRNKFIRRKNSPPIQVYLPIPESERRGEASPALRHPRGGAGPEHRGPPPPLPRCPRERSPRLGGGGRGERKGEEEAAPRGAGPEAPGLRRRAGPKARARDTYLLVLPLLHMHARHGGRRQHHREAQHHLRAPRHSSAGRRGLRSPCPRPRAAAERAPLPGRARLDPSSVEPQLPPGASSREPSAEQRPGSAEGAASGRA